MPTKRTLIQKVELVAGASNVTFANLPQNFSALKIVVSARSSFPNGGLGGFFMEFNGSSGGSAGYKMVYIGRGTENSGGSYTTSANYPGSFLRYIPSTGGTASTFSSVEIHIPNYTSSNYKTYSSSVVAEQNSASSVSVAEIASSWSNTAPITQIKFWVGQPDNVATEPYSTFLAGSTFYLYGITHVPIIRGGEVSIANGFKYHTFRSSGSIQVIEPGDVELAVQGGGGAGSGGISGVNYGAAGAGGNNYSARARVPVGTLTITVGSGGAGAFNVDGTSGTASSISSVVTASGGGFGQVNGDYGGSNAIYSGGYNNGYFGGGGAGAGGNASGGDPGVGVLNFDGVRRGGGGGANKSHTGITYGVDGGGTGWGGSYTGTDRPSPNGEQYRGGGGAGTLGGYAPNGGSGIVIIRYPYDGN